MATWIVGGVVLLIIGAILWRMAYNRRHGKTSCSGGCQNCSIDCAHRVK